MQSRPIEITLKENGRALMPPSRNHTIYKALCGLLAGLREKYGIDLQLMTHDRMSQLIKALNQAGIRYHVDSEGIEIEKSENTTGK